MATLSQEPAANVAALAWCDFLRGRRILVVVDVLFKVAEVWLLLPALAVLMAAVLAWSGRVAVSDADLLRFLLTPLGLFYGGLLASLTIAIVLFEQAGILLVAQRTGGGSEPTLWQTLAAATRHIWPVVKLGAWLAVLTVLAWLPFVLLAVLTYRMLLTEHDIYFYWTDRPPVFWTAAAIGGVLLAGAAFVTAWLYVRWSLALPILLFESEAPRAALRTSRERVRGAAWRFALVLLGWLAVCFLIGAILEIGFRFLAETLLQNAGERPVLLLIALLLAKGALVATWSFVIIIGHGLLLRRLYLERSEQPAEAAAVVESAAPAWSWRFAMLTLPLFLIAPLALWVDLSRYVSGRPWVAITAHRGHARAAPENTLSALRKAMESGADYAEIDVQQTADGVVVLLHDRDFQRVAGDSRRLSDLTYDEIKGLDVGSWFSPDFAGERVPTLEEAIKLVRGKMKLNIELKFFGPDLKLAPAVAQLVRDQGFESECIITSFNRDAVKDAQAANPKLRGGLIVAQSIGDISRFDLDVLAVRADHLSDDMLRAAHRRGLEVHAWTVNDEGQMTRLIKRGVNNILTSDPDLGIRVRDDWANLSGSERLVLASRLLLGLDP